MEPQQSFCVRKTLLATHDILVYLAGFAQETDYLGLYEQEALTVMPAVANATTKNKIDE
jgi:hypothetical protein